ncbi:MAG TPA: phosphopyruvate hydratase [Candidatus Woesebacteria bacterium]|nr:phosphopyruvate hydratase [Candidatus Woesebacteria bacterium]
MALIYALQAREILDGRGWPTVELILWLDNGFSTVTTVPTAVSKGDHDSLELRDNEQRMDGLGVQKAVNNINQIIAPQLIGKEVLRQGEIDQLLVNLDGTTAKSKLGANAILAVSQAVLKAGALSVGLPLYQYIQKKYQLVNEINMPNCIITALDGGVHGGKNLDFREFFIIPASYMSVDKAIEMAVVIKQKLENLLISKGSIHSVGITGGYTPNLYKNTDAFELLIEAIRQSKYNFAQDLFFGLNAAAYDIYEASKYRVRDSAEGMSASDLLAMYKKMRENYKLIYIEDPFVADEANKWEELVREIGKTTTIATCNSVSSRVSLIKQGIKNKDFNAVVIKPKQLGTISETMESIKLVKDSDLDLVISHSSGETNETLIVDLAVAVGADYVKFGPINRGERIAKYNRLLEIHREIEQTA